MGELASSPILRLWEILGGLGSFLALGEDQAPMMFSHAV